jgi:hypothetical protein
MPAVFEGDEPVRIDGAGAETANHHVQQLPAATQVKGPLSQPGAVNGTPRVEEMRGVASVHGRHDIERMAIRAVTDVLGNTITETVHERTHRRQVDTRVAPDPASQIEQLKEANEELTRANDLLNGAAALLAAALDRP